MLQLVLYKPHTALRGKNKKMLIVESKLKSWNQHYKFMQGNCIFTLKSFQGSENFP